MDLTRILDRFKEELRLLEVAIRALEQLTSGAPRRGRPPGSNNKTSNSVRSVEVAIGALEQSTSGAPRRGRPPGSKNKTSNLASADSGDVNGSFRRDVNTIGA